MNIHQNQLLGPKEPQDFPKTLPSPKTGGISPPLRIHFGKIFSAMLASRATTRPLKIHTEFYLICKSIFHGFSLILGGFWEDLGTKLASKIH